VVVAPLDAERETDSGIVLGAEVPRPLAAVLSVGSEVTDPSIKPGCIVLFRRDMGLECVFEGLRIAAIVPEEIAGVVSDSYEVRVEWTKIDKT